MKIIETEKQKMKWTKIAFVAIAIAIVAVSVWIYVIFLFYFIVAHPIYPSEFECTYNIFYRNCIKSNRSSYAERLM